MMAYFAAVALSFMVVYTYKASFDASNSSQAIAVSENADYAAEYAANLAISQLSGVARNGNMVTGDWVEAGIYGSGKASDQRRIAGAYSDYDFRVQVRSATLAKQNGTMSAAWLGAPGSTAGDIMNFNNTYEILATARKANFANATAEGAETRGGYTANDAYTSSVYSVVHMAFGDNPAGLNAPFTTFNADQGTIAVGKSTAYTASETGVGPGNSAGNSNSNNQNHATDYTLENVADVAGTFSVDGEDHLLDTVYPKMTLSSSKKEKIKTQRGSLTRKGNSITATGSYWYENGSLTVSYMADSRPIDYASISSKGTGHKTVYTPARPNPYVPETRAFSSDTDDRSMVSKYKMLKGKSGFYGNNGYYKAPESADQLDDSTMKVDQYFLGGKYHATPGDFSKTHCGFSVTLKTVDGKDIYSAFPNVMDDRLYDSVINQKSYKQGITIIDENSVIGVLAGSYADLKRFYYTHINGSASSWRTAFVGEWSSARKKPNSGLLDANNMLFDNKDSAARRRSMSKHYPVNKDNKILVHQMKWLSGSTIKDTGSNGKARVWTGRYVWVTPDFTNKWFVRDKATGQTVYAREFSWEEIVGQKAKRIPVTTSSEDNGMTITSKSATYYGEVGKDGLLRLPGKDGAEVGNEFNKLKTVDSVRIEGYPVTDSLGREVPEVVYNEETKEWEPVPIGLTEYCLVDTSGKLIPVNFTNSTTADMYGVMNGIRNRTTVGSNSSALFARRNFIEVVEGKNPDGSEIIRYYNDISDFEYLDDITMEDGTIEKDRWVSSVIIGMEDQAEGGADFDYTDIMFVLNVVPAIESDDTIIVGDDSENNKYVQWWELNPDAGLTGGPSQTPLSSTETPSSRAVEARGERTLNNYEYLVGGSDTETKSLVDGENGLNVSYNRIAFDGKGNIVPPEGYTYQSDDIIYYYLAKEESAASNDIDPDRYDDIFEFVSQELQQDARKDEYADCTDDMQRKKRGLARLKAQADAPGNSIYLEDIDTRGNDASGAGSLAVLPKVPSFSDSGEAEHDYLYNIREERYTARRQAKLAFGGGSVSMAVGKTDSTLKRETGDDGMVLPTSKEQHLFIAGEVPPKQDDDHIPEPRAAVNRVTLQPEGSYVPEMFVNGDTFRRLVDWGVFDAVGPDESGLSREQRVEKIMLRSIEQRSLPSLYISAQTIVDASGNRTFDTKPVTDLVYSSMLTGDKMTAIRKQLRLDEERTILGWHRGGVGANLSTLNLQDSYVAAMLTATGMQPYTLANHHTGDAGEVVAKIRHEIEADGKTIVSHLVNIDTGSRLPTFVFDKPIDGAGLLIINGNLHVKSTFAYYGMMIVLGDLIIEPTEGDYWRRDEAGYFTDAKGNRIYYENSKNRWFRLESFTHDDGKEYKSKVYEDENKLPLEPEMIRQYKGELAVQGQILVGGDIEVKYVSVTKTDETRNSHKGEVTSSSETNISVGSGDDTGNVPQPNTNGNGNGNGNGNNGNSGNNGNNGSTYERTTVTTVYGGKLTVVASEAARQMVADYIVDEDGGAIGRFILNKAVWSANSGSAVDHIWDGSVE